VRDNKDNKSSSDNKTIIRSNIAIKDYFGFYHVDIITSRKPMICMLEKLRLILSSLKTNEEFIP
jgi:hypothetical protein